MRQQLFRLLELQKLRHTSIPFVVAVSPAFEDWACMRHVGGWRVAGGGWSRPADRLHELQNMSELLLLGFEILLRRIRWGDLQRDALDDLQAESFDGHVLC